MNLVTPITKKPVTDITPEQLAEWCYIEKERCQRDFRYYLFNYVYITTPDGQVILYPQVPAADRIIGMLLNESFNIFKKSRRMAFSWIIGAISDWDDNFQRNKEIGFVSISEEDSKKLKTKAQFIYDHLPPWMKTPLLYENKTEMVFDHRNENNTDISEPSTILSLPASPNAGSGHGFYRGFLDEAAKLEYGEQIFSAMNLACTGGQMNIVSSGQDRLTTGKMFHRIFEGAPENGFKRTFYHYSENPWWTPELIKTEKQKMTPLQWNQEMEGVMEGEAGQPVYTNFDRIKSVKEIKPVLGIPMLLGWDTGFPQGIVWAQILEEGQRQKIFIYMDFTGEEKADDIVDVAQRVIRLHQIEFPQWNIKNWNQVKHYGDPHGKNKEDLDKRTRFQKIREELGINILWDYHRSETAIPNICPKFNLQGDGEPDIYIHPRCQMLISGFAGGYHRKEYKEGRAYDPDPILNIYSHVQKALEFIVNNERGNLEREENEWGERPKRKVYSSYVGGLTGTGY